MTGTAEGGPPRLRAPLTRERVLDAAVAYADQHGLAKLSMRKLAAELGFEVMSLYNHVTNKDDLIAGMVDRVAAEIEPPAVTGPDGWRTAMRASAVSARDALLRHPWAESVWSTSLPGPARTGYMDALLGGLDAAELGDDLVYLGFHAVTVHILGYIREELDLQSGTDDLEAAAADFMAGLGDDHPHLETHIRAHFSDARPDIDEYVFGLDLILDGLERVARPS